MLWRSIFNFTILLLIFLFPSGVCLGLFCIFFFSSSPMTPPEPCSTALAPPAFVSLSHRRGRVQGCLMMLSSCFSSQFAATPTSATASALVSSSCRPAFTYSLPLSSLSFSPAAATAPSGCTAMYPKYINDRDHSNAAQARVVLDCHVHGTAASLLFLALTTCS